MVFASIAICLRESWIGQEHSSSGSAATAIRRSSQCDSEITYRITERINIIQTLATDPSRAARSQ